MAFNIPPSLSHSSVGQKSTWRGWFLVSRCLRWESRCRLGCVLIRRPRGRARSQAHACWQESLPCGCRTEVPVSLLAVSKGPPSALMAPIFLLMGPSIFKPAEAVRPSLCLRQHQAGPLHGPPAEPSLTTRAAGTQHEPVGTQEVPLLSASPQGVLGPSTIQAGSWALRPPGSPPGLCGRGPGWMEPWPLLTSTVLM